MALWLWVQAQALLKTPLGNIDGCIGTVFQIRRESGQRQDGVNHFPLAALS